MPLILNGRVIRMRFWVRALDLYRFARLEFLESVFNHVSSIYVNLLERKKALT